jgi:hypothetical protein
MTHVLLSRDTEALGRLKEKLETVNSAQVSIMETEISTFLLRSTLKFTYCTYYLLYRFNEMGMM